jgi:hypothetical protein
MSVLEGLSRGLAVITTRLARKCYTRGLVSIAHSISIALTGSCGDDTSRLLGEWNAFTEGGRRLLYTYWDSFCRSLAAFSYEIHCAVV